MSVSGVKSEAIAASAARQLAGSSRLAPASAASAFAARFGVAAMPPKAIRADGDAVALDIEPERASMTAEMSSSRRFETL